MERACPGIKTDDISPLYRGPDHEVYVCEGRVFRFPRSSESAALLELEAAVLPLLKARLPTAIPTSEWSARSDDGTFYSAHRFVPGTPLVVAELDDEARMEVAPRLANFIKALHSIELEGVLGAIPVDSLGRLDMGIRGRSLREQLFRWRTDGLLAGETAARLFRILDDWPGLPTSGEPLVLTHGDLAPQNLLIDGSNRLSGVVDWVDLHRGLRAVDLGAVFEVLPPRARSLFFYTYGPVDAPTIALAQFRAIDHAARVLVRAIEARDEAISRIARRSLIETSERAL